MSDSRGPDIVTNPDLDRIKQLEEHVDGENNLPLKQRGELIIAACRAAAQIEQGRLASGLPRSKPAPWPKSTWQLLRDYAPNGRQRELTD